MMLRFPHTEQFFVTSTDNVKIHCYWIPAPTGEDEDEYESPDNNNNNLRGPVMIYCGPNGHFAEQMQY